MEREMHGAVGQESGATMGADEQMEAYQATGHRTTVRGMLCQRRRGPMLGIMGFGSKV